MSAEYEPKQIKNPTQSEGQRTPADAPVAPPPGTPITELIAKRAPTGLEHALSDPRIHGMLQPAPSQEKQVYAAARPRRETTGRVGDRPEAELPVGIEVQDSEGKRILINRTFPETDINPVVEAISNGLPTTWTNVDTEGGVYEHPETGQRIIVLPADSEESAHRDITFARRIERALGTEEAQARVAYQGDYAGVDGLPALAAHTDSRTGVTVVAYKGAGGNLVTETDIEIVDRVIEDLRVFFRRKPQLDAQLTPADIRIEEIENGEEVIHVIIRNFVSLGTATEPTRETTNAQDKTVTTPTASGEETQETKATATEISETEPARENPLTDETPQPITQPKAGEATITQERDSSPTRRLLPSTPSPEDTELASPQAMTVHPNKLRAAETRRKVEEAIRVLGKDNPSGRDLVALLPDIPERTIGRHLNAILGPRQLPERTSEELAVLDNNIASAINNNPSINRKWLAEELGISDGYLGKREKNLRDNGAITVEKALIGNPKGHQAANILNDFSNDISYEETFANALARNPQLTRKRFSEIASELRRKHPDLNIPYGKWGYQGEREQQ